MNKQDNSEDADDLFKTQVQSQNPSYIKQQQQYFQQQQCFAYNNEQQQQYFQQQQWRHQQPIQSQEPLQGVSINLKNNLINTLQKQRQLRKEG